MVRPGEQRQLHFFNPFREAVLTIEATDRYVVMLFEGVGGGLTPDQALCVVRELGEYLQAKGKAQVSIDAIPK